MRRRPPRSTRTDTLFPYTTLFRSEDDVLHAILDDGVEHGAPRGGEGGPGIALRLPADLLVRLTLAPLARGDRVRREDAGGDHELRHVAAFCLLRHQPAQQAVELARLLVATGRPPQQVVILEDRKSTRLKSSH